MFVNKLLVAFFAFISILVFEQSCQKIDTTDLGAELIPSVDNVNTFDTLLEVITANGCTSTSRLPTARSCNSSASLSNGTKTFVLSIVKLPSLNGTIFICLVRVNFCTPGSTIIG